uniref:Uncharacterized protein n=1 Tax=Arundo donax TaxID=35708 RepID=A0A0A9GFP5_ARUDO
MLQSHLLFLSILPCKGSIRTKSPSGLACTKRKRDAPTLKISQRGVETCCCYVEGQFQAAWQRQFHKPWTEAHNNLCRPNMPILIFFETQISFLYRTVGYTKLCLLLKLQSYKDLAD